MPQYSIFSLFYLEWYWMINLTFLYQILCNHFGLFLITCALIIAFTHGDKKSNTDNISRTPSAIPRTINDPNLVCITISRQRKIVLNAEYLKFLQRFIFMHCHGHHTSAISPKTWIDGWFEISFIRYINECTYPVFVKTYIS